MGFLNEHEVSLASITGSLSRARANLIRRVDCFSAGEKVTKMQVPYTIRYECRFHLMSLRTSCVPSTRLLVCSIADKGFGGSGCQVRAAANLRHISIHLVLLTIFVCVGARMQEPLNLDRALLNLDRSNATSLRAAEVE